MGLSRPTVESTRKNWFSDKFQSLPDLPRSGAPRKIKPDEAEKILKLVDEKPLSATDVLKIHLKNEGTSEHVATVCALLKKDPDGHFKFPHLWPVKFPQAGRLNYQPFGIAGSDFCLPVFMNFFKWMFGKRSASGRRQESCG